MKDRNGEELTSKQLTAADLLGAGIRPGEVAKHLDVSRETLWRWRTQNSLFREECELRRARFRDGLSGAMWRLIDNALAVAQEALREGDVDAALKILRLAGPHILRDADAERTVDRAPTLELVTSEPVSEEDRSDNPGSAAV